MLPLNNFALSEEMCDLSKILRVNTMNTWVEPMTADVIGNPLYVLP